MEDNIQIRERLTRTETKVDTILSNHLPHIEAKVDKVDRRVWIVLISIIISTLIGVATKLLLK